MLPSLNEITFKLFSQAKVKRPGKLVFKLEPESDKGPIWTNLSINQDGIEFQSTFSNHLKVFTSTPFQNSC
jgi:hypothetical protein